MLFLYKSFVDSSTFNHYDKTIPNYSSYVYSYGKEKHYHLACPLKFCHIRMREKSFNCKKYETKNVS